jgi:hypothetical protein
MSKDTLKAPRYEIRTVWNEGRKRFAVHDLQRDGEVVGTFDSARDASIQTTLLWLEHLRGAHRGKPHPVPLTSAGARGSFEAN